MKLNIEKWTFQENSKSYTYKFLDDTMKDDTVIIAATRMPDKVLDCLGNKIGI